jgi:hypothetical protein
MYLLRIEYPVNSHKGRGVYVPSPNVGEEESA